MAGHGTAALERHICRTDLFPADIPRRVLPDALTYSVLYMYAAKAMAVVSWAQFTKIVRAKVQSLKGLSYIEAAKICGEKDISIILRYILPNLVSTIIILATLALPSAILSTTSMGFLGLGAQQPLPDWGMILSEGIRYVPRAGPQHQYDGHRQNNRRNRPGRICYKAYDFVHGLSIITGDNA